MHSIEITNQYELKNVDQITAPSNLKKKGQKIDPTTLAPALLGSPSGDGC